MVGGCLQWFAIVYPEFQRPEGRICAAEEKGRKE